MRVADLLNEVRQPEAHEPACLVTDGGISLKGSSRRRRHTPRLR